MLPINNKQCFVIPIRSEESLIIARMEISRIGVG